MEIHRYEKLWFGLSLLLIVGFIATITYGAVGAGVQMMDDEGGTVAPDNMTNHPDFQDWPDTRAKHVEGNEYEIAVQARQFAFIPGTNNPIEVPANSKVTFYISSPDVTHGFSIVGTNVNTMVIPGQMSELTVEFDEPGEYGLICHEFCGAGHENMGGQVVVVPQDQWEGDQ